MDGLTTHTKEVLSAFASATEPQEPDDVVDSLLSAEPQIGWGSTRGRAFRVWLTRRNELHHAANILEVDGLLVTVPDVQGLVISESGRRALAEAVSD